jgi:hypothetical protein
MSRLGDLLDQVHEEILTMRIAVAQQRDGQLTPAELDAMLEIYQEFGR